MKRLTTEGGKSNIEKAEAVARECSSKTPRLKMLHRGAIRRRVLRRQFLAVQKKEELKIKSDFKWLADRADSILNRNGRDGAVPPTRINAVMEALAESNKEAYKSIASKLQAALRLSVSSGLRHSMSTAQAIQDKGLEVKSKEQDVSDHWPGFEIAELTEAVDPLRQTVKYAISSSIFKKLFKGALRKTMEAGMFGKTSVSPRVWDLRDQNLTRLRRMVAAGIAGGNDPATISRDIRGILVQPDTLRGAARAAARPGAGISVSAYSNAMRLARTETNRAYVMADTIFAEEKGWNLIWQVSSGQRENDECDGFNGTEMTPEEFANVYPVHPNDLCYSTLAPIRHDVGGTK